MFEHRNEGDMLEYKFCIMALRLAYALGFINVDALVVKSGKKIEENLDLYFMTTHVRVHSSSVVSGFKLEVYRHPYPLAPTALIPLPSSPNQASTPTLSACPPVL